MSDPSRTGSSPEREVVSPADRDAKLEELLLDGLDHYFAARYQQAINIWTRVLFLDRTHARARAYIERARSALAERQRQSEELLHTGVAAFERGEGGEARRLLQAAIDGGAPSDEALAILDRLNRLETGPVEESRTRAGRERQPLAPSAARAPSFVTVVAWIAPLAIVAAIGLYVAAAWSRWEQSAAPPEPPVAAGASALAPETAPRPPTRGELALARARTLASAGRMHDALSALDRIRPTDPQKADADALRAELQRRLLAPASDAPPLPGRGKDGQRVP